jgi:hypothetical protein
MKALAAEMCHSVVRKEDLVERYWKQRLVRFIPLIALVIFAAFLGPDKLNRLPGWARWAIFFYVVFSFAMPIFFFGGRSPRDSLATSKYAAIVQGHARTIWKLMLFFYIYVFVAGSVAVVIFRKVIPLNYAIIPLGVSLVLILLFCRILFWSDSSEPRHDDGRRDLSPDRKN